MMYWHYSFEIQVENCYGPYLRNKATEYKIPNGQIATTILFFSFFSSHIHVDSFKTSKNAVI